MADRKPVWTNASFLIYAGGLVVLLAALGALEYLASRYGNGGLVPWTLLVLAVLLAIAYGLRRRDRWLAAGIFAFASVIAWGAVVAALWTWFGWLGGPTTPRTSSAFHGFSVSHLSLELLILVAAVLLRRRFDFPFITAIIVFVGWFFVTDLVSDGGAWSKVVTVLVGLAYLAAAGGDDRPSAFWLHLASGVLIGSTILDWWHSSDWNWVLVTVAALVYVAIGVRTRRSSWSVLATVGLLAAGVHFTSDWTATGLPFFRGDNTAPEPRLWVPSVVFAFVGFLLVALGLFAARRDAE